MEKVTGKDLFMNPEWMPWEVTEQTLTFRHLTAERVRSAAFLDSRSAKSGDQMIKLPLAQLRTVSFNLHKPRPISHIFHLSHVGEWRAGYLHQLGGFFSAFHGVRWFEERQHLERRATSGAAQ